jgi:RHS repeat-associated protein
MKTPGSSRRLQNLLTIPQRFNSSLQRFIVLLLMLSLMTPTLALAVSGRRLLRSPGRGSAPASSGQSNAARMNPANAAPVSSNKQEVGRASRGKNFWLMLSGGSGEPAQLSLQVSAESDTKGSVAVPRLGFSTSFKVRAGGVATIELPAGALVDRAEQVEDKGIHLQAEQDVSVWAFNRLDERTDAYLGLPTTALGTEYGALGYESASSLNTSRIALVAVADNTNVTLTPSAATAMHQAGVAYSITLNEGQTYQLEGAGAASNNLSGTLVSSDKPLAALSGYECPPASSNDARHRCHDIEQLIPTETWGTDFVTMPLGDRNGSDTFRVLASTDDTHVSVDGAEVATLTRGRYFEQTITGAARITTDHPVSLAQYAQRDAQHAGLSANEGQPFDSMMVLPLSVDQFLNSYTVSSPASSFNLNYVNLTIAEAFVGTIKLDGADISAKNFTPIGASGFAGAQVALSDGPHKLSSPQPFGAVVYGSGRNDSYVFNAGLTLTAQGGDSQSLKTSTANTSQTSALQTTPCKLYPIALSAQSLKGVAAGANINDIFNGAQPGNFGWLTWAGSPSVPTLIESLTAPGNSNTYVNPNNSSDHEVSVGDWVQGKPGVSNSSNVRAALDALKSIDITVPVWDTTQGNGNNASYHINAFARIRLLSYDLPGQNKISARFLEFTDCPIPINQPPIVNAGPDQTITLPDGVALHGTATDDGLPKNSLLSVSWSKVSGPGTVTFADSHQAVTNAAFSTAGTYVLRLTASDSLLSASDDVVITVNPANQPPIVNAGPDLSIPDNQVAALNGTATDDGLPTGSTLAVNWSKISGPGTVNFNNPNSAATTAAFSAPGLYTLRLTGSDSLLNASDDVLVTVTKSNQPPVVDAGPDQTVTLPGRPPIQNQPFALRAISTGFNSPIGIDYHQPTGKVVMSVNYNNGGQPYNLELVAADGTRSRFSQISGLTDELKIATARDDTGTGMSIGGFHAGELFTGSGVPGVIVRVSPDGTQVQNPWVVLPGENGLMRGSLYVDRTGVYGGDLIVVTTTGGVWRITSAGQATQLTRLGTHLEGLQTIPNDPAKYGPWAGKILIGAEEQGRFYAVDAQGSSTFYSIGINPEDIDLIPANENFFGVDFSGQTLWGAPAAAFSQMVGDILVAQESPGLLYRVHWDGTQFQKTQLAQVPQWEHVTFAPAGIREVETVGATVNLHGTVTDDGLPAGATLNATWTKVSGPGTVSFADASQPVTTATFNQPGTYVLRLTANDSEFTVYDEVTININSANLPPVVDAGPDRSIIIPASASLIGTVTDDGLPAGSALSYSWTKVSGPGTVTFANAGAPVTVASFNAPGTYILRLTASDTELSGSDEMTVTVEANNLPPLANAGPDQIITLPNTASLNGTASDDGLPFGSTLTTTWSKVSGPGDVTFANPNMTVTTATFTLPGTYVLRLTASDSQLSASDDVNINVMPTLVGHLTCTRSSRGTDFWLMFPGNLGSPELSLFITGDVNTTGTVTIPGLNFGAPFTVTAGQVTTVTLPTGAAVDNSDLVESKGIHVVTQREVAVYGLNRIQFTTDAYLGLPTQDLGTDYVTLGYQNVDIINGTEFGIVATANGTNVTITPSLTTGARTGGVPYTITLNQGQTYQLRNTNSSPSDLSGSLISANHPVAVFGGHECANIPQGSLYCDHIVEQLPPPDTWGQHFVTMPLATRRNGDTFRLLAAQDNTSIAINGTVLTTLNRGKFYERIINGPAVIDSDKPILVAQYSNSTTFDGITSDPFMMLIPPFEQFGGNYTLTTPSSGFDINYINIVAPSTAVGAITLDGVAIPSASFVSIGGSGFSGAQVPVSVGSHNLSGTQPFGAFVYGFAAYDSYGYPGGVCLNTTLVGTRLTLAPKTASNPIGAQDCVVASVTDLDDHPVGGIRVEFTVTGVNPATGSAQTDASGQAQFCYTGASSGADLIVASVANITDTATKTWSGPLEGATLALAPAAAGPNVTGTTQTLSATLKNASNAPMSGALVQFTVNGPNATSGSATTDANGVAAFTYTGTSDGTDTAQASIISGTTTLQSNLSNVSWVTPVQSISTTTVLGRFFTNNTNSGVFVTLPTETPVFSQHFPTITFNPPFTTIPNNGSNVNETTRPFTNITTDVNGNYTGTIIAQGNNSQAGVNNLFDFAAVFTGKFTVAAAGDITFNFFSDDGFIFSVGNGATRVSGASTNSPPSGLSPFDNLPVMGAYNVPTAPVANSVTVHFPAPGTYPYEVDYSECCAGQLSLTMTTAASGNHGVPPTGALTLSSNSTSPKNVGQQHTFNAVATNASGAPLSNLAMTLVIEGANPQQLNATTNAQGQASFSYIGATPGTDIAQVVAQVGSNTAYSNQVAVQWNGIPNQAPIVNAGSDQTAPPCNVNLHGSVTDDGLPVGSTLALNWTKISGPGNVVFSQPNAASTTANFDAAGVYVLRLTASDSQLTGSDDVVITVTGASVNNPPSVNAGPDQSISAPLNNVILNGTVSDDGLPSCAALTINWTKVSGPGTVTFSNPNSATTTATFGSLGTYVLRLTASDSALSASDDVIVTVNAVGVNQPPTVDAGPDQTATLGVNLLQNASNEEPLVNGEIPGWTEVQGNDWKQAPAGTNGFPASVNGNTYFDAGLTSNAELRQDVDVRGFGAGIANGTQQFELKTYLRSGNESPADTARIILEYRDASNANVLATLDSGPTSSINDWLLLEDTRPAVPGTGWIRIRLIATRNTGTHNDAFFDALSFRALSTVGVKLNGTVADDGLPANSTLSVNWTKISGPGNVAFAQANQTVTSATISAPGTYVLRLSATDSLLSASDDITITINGPNQAPSVNAGADQSITLPATSSLSGTTTDDGLPAGSSVTSNWTKVSGPGTVTFAQPQSLNTTATFSAPGSYVLRLTATDTELSGSDDITINVQPAPANQAPVVNAGADQTLASVNDTATLSGTATDDGLPANSTLTLNWTKISGPGTVSFSQPHQAITTATFSAAGSYILRLSASDTALTASDDVLVTVNGTNQTPTVNAGADQTIQLPATAALNGTASDDGLPVGSSLTTTWSMVSGPGTVTFANPNLTTTNATFSTDGTYVLRLTASDSALSATDDVNITVNAATPPPTVAINSPADGTEVSGPVPVTGFVSGGSNWRLEYSLNGDEGTPLSWTTINTGSTAVNNGTLGNLDPTLLLNGIYAIRLIAVDGAGQTSMTSVSVVVKGEQKVGNFTISFIDVNVPVGGLPIQVIRSYDSRDKRQGDFGIGWTLGIKNLRVEKSGIIGKNWEETRSPGILPNYCVQPTRSHTVTVTFPNGKVYKFQAGTSPQCQRVVPIQTANMVFTPMAGTQGALEVVGATDVFVVGSYPGPVDVLDFDTLDFFNPTLFKLTTEDGTAYVVDQQGGVQSMTDSNGNTLNINANGITHSSGKSVAFTRDSQGRITQITDPAGNAMVYTYDASGNLINVKDRENNVTTFSYNSTHGLLTILDPRGIQPVRNEYDSNGRLISQTDAFGKTITYSSDLSARQEVATDRLGNATVFQYDTNGNVLSVTDAKGNTTTRSYDANDNMLSETNALGKITNFTYDAQNNRTSVTDPLGNVTRFTYNARKQVLTITDSAGHVLTNNYDANGNLTSQTDLLGNTSSAAFNSKGLITSATDAQGNLVQFEYDASGNLTKQTDAVGNSSTFTYAANGQRLSQTDTRLGPGGVTETLVTTYEYDRLGHPTRTIYPNGATAQTVYNSTGQRSSTTDQLGHQTTYEYDEMGRQIRTNYPDGTKEEAVYDAEGHRTKSVDRAGRNTTYTYDALGRLEKTTYSDGTFTTNTYNAVGAIIAVTDAHGNKTQYEYDAAGRRTKVTDALGHFTTATYDGNGNQTQMTDARGQLIKYEYDADNRRIRTLYADGSDQKTTYDILGQMTSRMDQAGKTTQFEYDKDGRLIKVTDALGQVTSYTYDEQGHRLSQTDANNHTTRFAYDRLGHRTKRTLPSGLSETYAYDAGGNLTSKTDFNGKTTVYAYDVMNRLTSKTPDASLGEPSVSFTYTVSGKRATMSDASGTTVYTYDIRDRLTSKATPQGTLSYTYNDVGTLLTARSSHAGGVSMAYTYDALNRLDTVTENGLVAGTTNYTYDVNGNLESYTYPNAVKSLYTYNSLNRLTNLEVSHTATPLAGYAYTLGAAGNRLSVTEQSGRTVGYSYDDLYRLTGETIASDPLTVNNGALTYTYDAVGNRLSRTSTIAAIPATTSTYTPDDHLTSDTYDNNGSTTASGSNTYTYDFEHRIKDANGGAIHLVYDGDGNRVAKTVGGVTTKYLVDDLNPTGYAQVLEELVGGSVQHVYAYGHDLISQRQLIGGVWQTSFYGYDGQGSVRFLTNMAGTVTDTYDYDAYGVLLSRTGTTPNNYLYTGEQYDPDLGFYYLRARYMNTATGRFWTMDSYEGNSSDPLSLHKYLYAGADPVNNVDPTGNFEFSIAGLSINISIMGILQNMAIGAFTSALLGAGDALFGGRDVYQAAVDGAIFGAITGPFAGIKYIRAILAGVGIGISSIGALQAYLDEDYDLAAYRGTIALAGALITWRAYFFDNVRSVDPATLRWTQTSAGGNGRANVLRLSMQKSGWQGPPIDVVETPDGLVTVDHTRAAVALEMGIKDIPVRVHQPNEPLPAEMGDRFTSSDGRSAATWGDAIGIRAGNQNPPLPPTGTNTPPRLPPQK